MHGTNPRAIIVKAELETVPAKTLYWARHGVYETLRPEGQARLDAADQFAHETGKATYSTQWFEAWKTEYIRLRIEAMA